MADSGFPVAGRRPRTGPLTPEVVYVLKFLYVETKESGPLGGVSGAPMIRQCSGIWAEILWG